MPRQFPNRTALLQGEPRLSVQIPVRGPGEETSSLLATDPGTQACRNSINVHLSKPGRT